MSMRPLALVWRVLLACALGLASATAFALPEDDTVPAGEAAAAGTDTQVLDTVLITGSQPGPGLWQVVKGEHRMWVVATLSPIPKDVEWLADEVREKVAQSGAVLRAPGVRVASGIGVVRTAFLVPSLLKARRNPDDAELKDVLPADLYARWAGLKQRYLPRNRRIERWRPIFAAGELRGAAAKSAGLAFRDPVTPVVLDAAKKAKVPVLSATVDIDIEIDKPRRRLKALARTTLDDHECFRLSLDAIETDIRQQSERGNAWAIGDLDTLRVLTRVEPVETCLRAAMDSAAFDGLDIDFDDFRARAHEHWLSQAESVIAEYATSFAVLSLQQVMADDGLLARLRARGYTIIAPDDLDAADEPATGGDHEAIPEH